MHEAIGRPCGRPVRESLETPQDRFGKRLRAAIRAIDSVHGDGSLPRIPVIETKHRTDMGVYNKHRGTGQPVAIEISRRKNDNVELTFVHEVGHFLEGTAIPGVHFGVRQWELDENVRGWRQAVIETYPYQELRRIREEGFLRVKHSDGREDRISVQPDYAAYLGKFEELWGRSYAQYIAVRSRDETLLKQVEARRSKTGPYPLQWSDREFGPIAEEFDSLFKAIGWRS